MNHPFIPSRLLVIACLAFFVSCGGGGGNNNPPVTVPTAPTVTTTAVTGIASTSASSGGNVSSDGGASVTARGVCWSTSTNPTTANSHTADGTGTGSFTSSIMGLTASTTYHVRAYATNSVGTAYGNDLTFTTSATPASTPKLGTNLSWMSDWDPEKMAADLMLQARPWSTGDGNGYEKPYHWAPVDSYGWPIVSVGTDFGAIFEGSPWVGVYKLSFKNRQGTTGDTVWSSNGNITLTNRQHNAGTNVTTYDVNVPSFVNGQFIWLMWDGTTGGVTDVHLMRPLKDGSGWHAVGTILSDHIHDRLAHFTTIRTMITGSGSELTTGTDTVWSGRTKPWSSQQRSSDAGRPGGAAIEILVAMANESNKDLWINIPFRANDDYIRKMAQVIRFGSDGTNPYTLDQTSPVFAPLKSNLKLYVEHGNEIWNPGYGYWSSENETATQAELDAGDPNHLHYCNSGSLLYGYSWRRVGWLAVRHSLIFREVFGDPAMMTRVRPILATQNSRYGTTEEPLNYIRDVWGRGYNTQVAYGEPNEYGHTAQRVNYYIYALATALYFPDTNQTVNTTSAGTMIDSIHTQLSSTAAESLLVAAAWNKSQATSFGIEYVAYEGGDNLIPNLMPGASVPATLEANTAKAILASYDPVQGSRMGANIDGGGLPLTDQSNYVYGRVFSGWAALGGGLFMHFTLGQTADASSMFGLCPPSAQSGSDPRLETGPKWDAIKAFGKAWGQ